MARKLAGWHVENIKAELRKRYGTLAGFAKASNLSPQIVSDVLRTPNASARVEQIIANALDVSAYEIWPKRWTVDGYKIDRARFRRNAITSRSAA